MLEKVKKALRISNIAFNDEITTIINACKLDLQVSGVVNVSETDALIERAIILYSKANFGNNPDSEKFMKAYECLKLSLVLSSSYIEETEEEE